MNHNAGSKEINNLEEITKRVYYLSFEVPWLPSNQQEINYNMLINDNNDHIYRYVVSELNKRLVHLTGEEEANLIEDYLSLTKEILGNLLNILRLLMEMISISMFQKQFLMILKPMDMRILIKL